MYSRTIGAHGVRAFARSALATEIAEIFVAARLGRLGRLPVDELRVVHRDLALAYRFFDVLDLGAGTARSPRHGRDRRRCLRLRPALRGGLRSAESADAGVALAGPLRRRRPATRRRDRSVVLFELGDEVNEPLADLITELE